MTSRSQSSPSPSGTSCSVVIVGRMGASITDRVLPSGDALTVFTVVVDRPRDHHAGAATVDALPCQAFRASVRTAVARLEAGQLVEVTGTLRRRFWRGPVGLGSALEVDVSRIRAVR